MTTYYYPSTYGTAEFNPNATASGTATFSGNYQSPAGSYTVITAQPGTNPQEYTLTTDYTGPGTGTTFTVTQTPYSDANHNETYGVVPGVGPAYFLLTNGTVPATDTYTFTGTSTAFQPTGGSTTDPTCFASGTLIRTLRGNVKVEDLVVGDIAIAASGSKRPIRWLGHRALDCRRNPQTTRPIRISAHAFGEKLPARDLFVSPGHAICVDVVGEVLIPAGLLVNGSTIVQVEVDEVTYWHVELEGGHDVILAENLPAESYLDMGNRGFFQEADVFDLAAGPDAAPAQRTHADFCRPFVNSGPTLDAVRDRLAVLAAAMASRGGEQRAA